MAIREYHAPRILAAVFFLILLAGGWFAYGWNRQDVAIHAQEMQAVRECEERLKSQAGEDVQVSFQDISAERFGSARIIVTGTAVFTSASGQARTEKMNCIIEVPASGP